MFGPRGTTAAAGRSRMESLDKLGPRRGRPRKFMGPSRAVTLTLPDYVLDALSAIDPDLSRAVVRLTQPELAKQPHPPAELVRFGQSAVIVVNPTRTLEQRTGVNLIPLPDGRALISFDEPFTVAEFELMIADALDDSAALAIRSGDLPRHRPDPACRAPIEVDYASPAKHHRAGVTADSPARHVETFDCALPAVRTAVVGPCTQYES